MKENLWVPHNRPEIDPEDIEAVVCTLRSLNIAGGASVRCLEQELSQLMGGGSACAVSSGTAALALALKALGIKQGCHVAVPAYSCNALLEAVHFCGASVRVIDVDENFSLCPSHLRSVALQTSIDAIIAVHTFGYLAPIDELRRAAPGVGIVEDCCHSIGGEFLDGELAGQGDVSVYSFYATKPIVAGEGGLIWSRRKDLVEYIRSLIHPKWVNSGDDHFNFRLTDIQASLARSQLTRLMKSRRRRADIAVRYGLVCNEVGQEWWTAQIGVSKNQMIYRFILRVADEINAEHVVEHFRARRVEASRLFRYEELLHRLLRLKSGCPMAEHLSRTTVSIPLFTGMQEAEIEQVEFALRDLGRRVKKPRKRGAASVA